MEEIVQKFTGQVN